MPVKCASDRRLGKKIPIPRPEEKIAIGVAAKEVGVSEGILIDFLRKSGIIKEGDLRGKEYTLSSEAMEHIRRARAAAMELETKYITATALYRSLARAKVPVKIPINTISGIVADARNKIRTVKADRSQYLFGQGAAAHNGSILIHIKDVPRIIELAQRLAKKPKPPAAKIARTRITRLNEGNLPRQIDHELAARIATSWNKGHGPVYIERELKNAYQRKVIVQALQIMGVPMEEIESSIQRANVAGQKAKNRDDLQKLIPGIMREYGPRFSDLRYNVIDMWVRSRAAPSAIIERLPRIGIPVNKLSVPQIKAILLVNAPEIAKKQGITKKDFPEFLKDLTEQIDIAEEVYNEM